MKDIESQLPVELKSILYVRRKESINQDEKLRYFTLEKVSSTFFDEERARLAQFHNKEFRTKKRVTALMRKDNDDIERLRNEIVEKVANLEKELGMNLDSGMNVDVSFPKVNVIEDPQHEHVNEEENVNTRDTPLVEENIVEEEKDGEMQKEDEQTEIITPSLDTRKNVEQEKEVVQDNLKRTKAQQTKNIPPLEDNVNPIEEENTNEDNFDNAGEGKNDEKYNDSIGDKENYYEKKDEKSMNTNGESFGTFKDSLKILLGMQFQFQLVVSTQLLPILMQQGKIDMDKISPL